MTLNKTLRLTLSMFIALSMSAPFMSYAQEQSAEQETSELTASVVEVPEEQRTYAPEYCDFTALFPEAPVIRRQCEDPENQETCFQIVSFTKVLEMSSTVRAEIICNPSTTEMYNYFEPEIMEKTVRAMTQQTVIEAFRVDTVVKDQYRQTGLVGKGRKGMDDSIYIAQLWVSENSIMSVEAELSGVQNAQADELFAEVLGNIGLKEELIKQESETNSEAADDSSADQQNKENVTPKEN